MTELEYTLHVSYDCGSSYCPEFTSSNLEEVKKEAETYDEQGLRWSIEDQDGNPQSLCTIHAEILATMAVINAQ